MRNEPPSRELIVGGTDMPAPGDIEALYVDADAAIREWTRAAMADQRGDLSVAGVGTVEAVERAPVGTHLPALDRIGLLDYDERRTPSTAGGTLPSRSGRNTPTLSSRKASPDR